MKDTQEVLTQSADETKIIASNMSKDIKMNSVIALYGDIGTGKTTFTQGFALGMGVNEHVTSPTFKLVSEYSGDSKKLYHIDCYRMKGSSDFLNIGGELFLNPGDGVTIIEWANVIDDLLLPDTITVQFNRNFRKPEERILKIKGWYS